MRILPNVAVVVSLVVVVSVVIGGACDLLGVRCVGDGDCPDDQPFCVDDICVTSDEAEKRGRDVNEGEEGEGEEGEGEPECEVDSTCAPGLCVQAADAIDAELAETGTCLPPADTEDCSSTAGGGPRDPAGPALWDVTSEDVGDGCFHVTAAYFDREGDAPSYAEAGADGSCCQTTEAVLEEGRLSFSHLCPLGTTNALFVVDAAGDQSNSICFGEGAP